jgi:hypothetical protein
MQTIAIQPAVEPNGNGRTSRTPVFSALNEYYRILDRHVTI